MVRVFTKWILATGSVLAVLTAGSQAYAQGDCAREFRTLAQARADLEAKVASNLASPPQGPYRVLKPGEYTLREMNDGKSFDFNYTDSYNVVQYWRPKKTIGQEITFTNSKGQPHTIQIVGSSLRRGLVEGVTDKILKLPADTLESVSRVEVQSFVQNTTARGYALDSRIVLHEDGSALSTVRHEFGHSVARYIWGHMNPYGEWDKAFKADGSRYVSAYARDSVAADKRVGLSEDFAEAVEGYLRDTDQFRKSHPNRAALLDTVFRNGGETIADSPFANGGVWNPIQGHYNNHWVLARRWAEENPAIAGLAIATTGGSISAAVVFYRECSGGRCEGLLKPSPAPTPRPPPKASVNPN